MLIDLQLHSTYSDGYLTPTEVARFIAARGVKIAALTDHNTVSGLDEFRHACRSIGIKPITGLELYAKFHKYRFNVLWYNFNETVPALHDLLRSSQVRRRRQVRTALKKLVAERGFRFDFNKILDKYTHYVPINHIADDLIAIPRNWRKIKKDLKQLNPREGDILGEYFHNRKTYFLKNSFIDIDRIMALREEIGGKIILCHPGKHFNVDHNLLRELKKIGLDGLEILSPHHTYGGVMYYQHWARELDLIETGGSDFHRFEGNKQLVQYAWQYYKIDSALLRQVKKIIG